ncbi:hypothetical protein PGTUg99_023874 [Puccinia graminis f. sp. tritici]|uniref:Uncharacterized protein n=1 Tax=Puccinia graminis f. sp. tritici TaxID=56615 RepID=A0A5B0S7X7_PUCGR|nr:hypothetical protein PGTUg99_023874 [Puccinia graminis f. sp. tritici]
MAGRDMKPELACAKRITSRDGQTPSDSLTRGPDATSTLGDVKFRKPSDRNHFYVGPEASKLPVPVGPLTCSLDSHRVRGYNLSDFWRRLETRIEMNSSQTDLTSSYQLNRLHTSTLSQATREWHKRTWLRLHSNTNPHRLLPLFPRSTNVETT